MTPFCYYAEANYVLDAVEKATRHAQEIRLARRGHLTVTTYASVSISLLSRLLAEFARQRSGLQMKIISRDSQSVRELMTTYK